MKTQKMFATYYIRSIKFPSTVSSEMTYLMLMSLFINCFYLNRHNFNCNILMITFEKNKSFYRNLWNNEFYVNIYMRTRLSYKYAFCLHNIIFLITFLKCRKIFRMKKNNKFLRLLYFDETN